jgi:rare lipoprotein A
MFKVKKLCVYGAAAMSLGLPVKAAMAQCGTASWYHEGARTANGERFRPDGISAAHRTLPFGTRVQVRNQRTGRSIVVRINDRGPFIRGRIIDLSRGAQRALGMGGLAPVCLAVLGRGESRVASAEDNEQRVIRRRVRTRTVMASVDMGAFERPALRRSAAAKKRHARHHRRSHVAAIHREDRRSARRARLAEQRAVSRRARRAEARQQRRLLRKAAAEWRANAAGL